MELVKAAREEYKNLKLRTLHEGIANEVNLI